MGYVNKVIILGRLGQDPEKRVTPNGATVVNLSVATTETWKNKAGEKQEKTEWHRVIFWNKQADAIEQYLSKGNQIYIEGSLETREWTDKDSVKRYTTEIKGERFTFVDSKVGGGQGQEAGAAGQNTGQQQQAPGGQADDFIEDDIPF